MKTSLVLIVGIILNTSALLAEPLSQLVNGIDYWIFIALEVILILTLYVHHILRGLHTINQIDYKDINLFVIKSKDKISGES